MSGGGAPARWDGDDLVLRVRVQPRASRDEIVGIEADSLKVRITAPPAGGAANARLLQVLAKAFGVAKGRIVIEAGSAARDKRVRIPSPARVPPGITPRV